jgi:hypothetical protein
VTIRTSFRVGTLRLKEDDAPRLERAVARIRADTREGLARCAAYEAAARRFRAKLLNEVERMFLDA